MEDLKMGMIFNLSHHLLCTELLVLVIFMVCFPAATILKKTTKSAMLFSCGHGLFVSSHCLC